MVDRIGVRHRGWIGCLGDWCMAGEGWRVLQSAPVNASKDSMQKQTIRCA